MSELERLRAERRSLLAKQELEGEMEQYGKDVKSLKRENFALRHRKKVRVVKKIGSGVGAVGGFLGRGALAIAEQAERADASRRPQPQRRRVKKVKKKTSKKPVKRVKKVKRRRSPQSGGYELGFNF